MYGTRYRSFAPTRPALRLMGNYRFSLTVIIYLRMETESFTPISYAQSAPFGLVSAKQVSIESTASIGELFLHRLKW